MRCHEVDEAEHMTALLSCTSLSNHIFIGTFFSYSRWLKTQTYSARGIVQKKQRKRMNKWAIECASEWKRWKEIQTPNTVYSIQIVCWSLKWITNQMNTQNTKSLVDNNGPVYMQCLSLMISQRDGTMCIVSTYLGRKKPLFVFISADQIEIISFGKPKYMHIDARVEIIFGNRPLKIVLMKWILFNYQLISFFCVLKMLIWPTHSCHSM